jgi:hypothetical protein
MDKLVYKNPLLKYIACFNVRGNEKEILKPDFVKLGCWGFVKRAPHIIKWSLGEIISPHPTSWDRVMHLLRIWFSCIMLEVLLAATRR